VTILIIGSILLGAVLGRFFMVWILVPVYALTSAIVFTDSACYGYGLSRAFLTIALLATCLQIGYASGLLSDVIPGMRRLPKKPRESSRSAAPSIAATRYSKVF
jgi:hypothetical protein